MDSALGAASSGDANELGVMAAIRIPMLRVSNFKGGTPELIQACYAILVLVLPNANGGVRNYQEMEIVKVIVNQVAVGWKPQDFDTCKFYLFSIKSVRVSRVRGIYAITKI
ncbi:hypothetical protein IFM89_019711 [Coptis chinensis]|uniref:Uncharacterized protein n=1 Tax=Coptis chinensis TaxID=261450 RepID=A0A835GZW0_9MAGN|nr:hypothetical protein IFM89_019711 [Coptis chinensis]